MMLTEDEIAELAKRRQQLAARTGAAGYKENCEALKARIAELEAKRVG